MSQGKSAGLTSPLKIGIIGAGFSGTALLAALHKLSHEPVEVILFEKTGTFAAGHAYQTPFAFHLLNARASDMSAFEDNPHHFSDWLKQDEEASHYLDKSVPVEDQYVPRFLYRHYLQQILDVIRTDTAGKVKVTLSPTEVVDIVQSADSTTIVTHTGEHIKVNKVVLAVGVTPPGDFPFPVADDIQQIINPWDYAAVKHIPADDTVLIVGTGLSMIDAVLTLHHHQHKGAITAVSRHGLLPLSHAEEHVPARYEHAILPADLRTLTRYLRTASQDYMDTGGDWRTLINSLRHKLPAIWQSAKLPDKKRFLRHVLPYWNIHRHRVINQVTELLAKMRSSGSLTIYGGRITDIRNGKAKIKLRRSHDVVEADAKWVINCMGFSLTGAAATQPLVASMLKRGLVTFDALRLGFSVLPPCATTLFTLGPPAQGEEWETVAVPEIRKYCANLALRLLGND